MTASFRALKGIEVFAVCLDKQVHAECADAVLPLGKIGSPLRFSISSGEMAAATCRADFTAARRWAVSRTNLARASSRSRILVSPMSRSRGCPRAGDAGQLLARPQTLRV